MSISKKEIEIAGSNIRRLAREGEIAISKMADDLGMNRPYVYEILNGEANPSFEVLTSIANYLGVKVRDLLTENLAPKKEKAS